ncbi:fimbrial chaperone [Proteus vulgaris]|uniref:fimbrial biogenesis chaperone n=1 Tax=Proteus vulgaris TaxID=585 RepID=UPI000E06CE16|nr:molecular chaperone [Proteus vulgaris]SUC19506.1 fimbrial chaperone [Proteus vulgaris]
MLIRRQWLKWGLGFGIWMSSFAFYAASDSGLRFSTTRIVYQQGEKGGAYAELENSSTAPYLIQSWIAPVDTNTGLPSTQRNEASLPFVITPPLTRLAPGERYRWRIQQVNQAQLSTDKESVFYLALKAIPTTENKAENKGEFVLSPVIYLKMLYRPHALQAVRLDHVASQLGFKREGHWLIVDNPTPLSMTFSSLQVGTYSLPEADLSKMVPPFGQQSYALPENVKGDIFWRVLNEYGLATKIEQRALTSKEPS